jgi:hypothetical protein
MGKLLDEYAEDEVPSIGVPQMDAGRGAIAIARI